ncbi:c-type cytochrome [Dyadobacter fermentans]|uniref:Cytochrome c-related protein n=1 Tax=Dyadobacter fermentans (strain ATCC 700827 / DSM 18053 / CIP 107007 / KCTC 52180 / NS114) TaxID=471854 RepID=C6VTA5_DYAFD|nr:c-type cytochrome [Dyadobacter fermentans]ACT96469.1 cytochrome c-related protein [Dyadobacter fermentans DSM 18053]
MKRKLIKWTLRIALGVTIPLAALLLYVQFSYRQKFSTAPTGIRASNSPEAIARGRYLVTGPGHCESCHAPDGTERLQTGSLKGLIGGLEIKLPFGIIYTPNLTPDKATGIGKYSDEVLASALRHSVKHDGTALIPFMSYNTMSDEDIAAVISYLRSIRPVPNDVPEHDLNILGKIVHRFALKPFQAGEAPPKSVVPDTTARYGKYLALSVGNCAGCHTNRGKTGDFIGAQFAGGYRMPAKTGTYGTPNLTPDPETGTIAQWSVTDFIKRFRQGALFPDSPMPWKSFGVLTDNDLKALYYFLQSLEPVKNAVPRYTPHDAD